MALLSQALAAAMFLLLSAQIVGAQGTSSSLEPREVVERLRIEVARHFSVERPPPAELLSLIRLAGDMALKDSVSDLVFLLDNSSELEDVAEECIAALGKIGDERAIVSIVGQLRWQGGSGQVLRAIDALAAFHRPIAPILFRALASTDALTRQRASQDIALLARADVQGKVEGRVPIGQGWLFRISAEGSRHLLALRRDPVVAVRYEALSAYLAIRAEDSREPLGEVAEDPDPSMQQLLIQARAGPPHWWGDSWDSIRAIGLDGPGPPSYHAVSEWAPWKNGLSVRVAISDSHLSLAAPIYLLNRPVWMRIELRNDGSSVVEVPASDGVPLVQLGVRDEFGTTERCGPHPQESHFAEKALAVAPAESLIWEFQFLRECRFRANGMFTIHGNTAGTGAVLLAILVRDLPQPPWRPDWYPHLGMSPVTVEYPRAELEALPEVSPSPISLVDPGSKPRLDASDPLTGFIQRQDPALLIPLTHQLSIDQITDQLKALRVPVPRIDDSRPAILAHEPSSDRMFFGRGRLLLDRDGLVHAVFPKSYLVHEVDNLGNRDRWLTETYYMHGDAGEWSTPIQLSSRDVELDEARLLLDGNGALLLVAVARNDRPRPSPLGLEPGGYDVVVRARQPDGEWSIARRCLSARGKMLHGFDAAVDDAGKLHLVWAPWFSNDRLERIYHRVITSHGLEPEQELPGGDRNLSNPKLRFVEGEPVLVAYGQTPDHRAGGLFWSHLTAEGWQGPFLIEDGTPSFEMPISPTPHPLVFGALEPRRSGTLSIFRFESIGMEKLASSFGLPDADGFSEMVSIATDAAGRVYGLANWRGTIVLFRAPDQGETEAVVIWNPAGEDIREAGQPRVRGRPDLLIHGSDWYALWATEGGATSKVLYRHGPIPKDGWVDARRLSFLLRPAVGLATSDLAVLKAGVFSEARTAEEQGRLRGAIERYIYLLLNSAALGMGGHWAKDGEIALSLERVRSLHASGNEEIRAYLWEMVKHEPEAIYRTETLWRLLEVETKPRVRIESSGR